MEKFLNPQPAIETIHHSDVLSATLWASVLPETLVQFHRVV